MIAHELIVVDQSRWGFGRAFQARCSCRLWESPVEETRPDAIRHHTVHAAQYVGILS